MVAVIETLSVCQILHILESIIEDVGHLVIIIIIVIVIVIDVCHLDLGEAEVRPVLDSAIIIESVEDRVHKVTNL